MPLPMVHFAVAIGLGERAGVFPSPAFLLGSIAPDAIHMRPEQQPDSKEVTHLNSPPDTLDHARLWDMLAQHVNSPLSSFAAGYAAHVLTDRLWIDSIMVQFRESVASNLDESARRSLYYRETDQVDYNLYQNMPWRPDVWTGLAQAVAPDFPPLLTGEEIHLWRERTLHWFEDPTHDPHITPQYITDEMVRRFIENAVERVAVDFALREVQTL